MKNIILGFVYGIITGIILVMFNQPKHNEAFLKDAIITVQEEYIKNAEELDAWANSVWKQLK